MRLIELLKQENLEKFEQLTNNEYDLLEPLPFMTESCAYCSHLRWIEEDIAACSDEKEIWQLGTNPGAEELSPEDALGYFKDICTRYDGEPPYTKAQVLEFIKRRNEVITKVAGNTFLLKLQNQDYFNSGQK
jgi:hypothetical protein|tara:strand:- start:845 stop:1240 length:396 start_codon:yes stop_codon:yes gene_type:complete